MNSYPLNYPEGKYKMHKCIAQLIPENNCNTYIEPFCGGETVVVELLFYGVVKNICLSKASNISKERGWIRYDIEYFDFRIHWEIK